MIYIQNHSLNFTVEQLRKIEEVKKARYVCETALPEHVSRYGYTVWSYHPWTVFWQDEAYDGSHYFGLCVRGTSLIRDASAIATMKIDGYLLPSGQVIYSRYRHDFEEGDDGYFIDGGRDYTRGGGPNLGAIQSVTITARGGRLYVNELEVGCSREKKSRTAEDQPLPYTT